MSTSFNLTPSLPQASEDEQALSHALSEQIKARIKESGGQIPFSEFMALALYAPELGYYQNALPNFGKDGDFTTAPELSSLFGQCLAHQCIDIIKAVKQASVLEIGAGTGKLAADLLNRLTVLDRLPTHYYILEISDALREQQRNYLQTHCAHYFDHIIWLNQLPESFNGVIIANEVMDAMPAERFYLNNGGMQQYFVGMESDSFCWQLNTANGTLSNTTNNALANVRQQLPNQYTSEINLNINPWINDLSNCLETGAVLLMDYGYSRREYYHPERSDGTLMCYFKQHAHSNPLILPGIQDISTHVDFTQVAENAIAANLQVTGYTNQANFLLGSGIAELATEKDFKAIKTLTLPGEMGEAIKCMALTKNFDAPLQGFALSDLRHKL